MERKTSSHILYGPLKDSVESMIKDVLEPVRAQGGIFIYLEADHRRVRFLGVYGGQPDSEAAEQLGILLQSLRQQYDLLTEEQYHRRLFELIFYLQEKSGLSFEQMQGAAVHWLMNGSIRLGNTGQSKQESPCLMHWSDEGECTPLLRFQDTLDWAATYGHDLEKMKHERADIALYETINRTILKIPHSAARRNLITGANLEIFLAEHIIALDREAFAQAEKAHCLPDPSLTFFFMPIRGLGQWRAAINWIQRETGEDSDIPNHNIEEKLRGEASELSKSALEELLTLSLINIFTHTARKALAPFTMKSEEQRERLRDAFAVLWWSKEMRLYKEGACIELLRRSRGSDALVPVELTVQPHAPYAPVWNSISRARYEGFFSYNEQRHPQLTNIRLVIDPVIARVTDDVQERARLKKDSPFDEVQYETYLFDADEEEIRRFVDQLGECLEQIVREQNLRRIAHEQAQYTVYEDIGHILNATLSLAGLSGLRTTLRTDLRALVEELPALRKVSNSLTLLTIMEGTVGLLRLIGILHRQDYSKLEDWFDEKSLAYWESQDEKIEKKVFEHYREAVVHLARAMGSAMGRPWVEVTVGNETTRYDDEDCHLDLCKLNFLPLSKSRRGEAIYALLPALVEPLRNALLFLEDKDELLPAREPIKLIIEDNRRRRTRGTPHILVKVGNLCPSHVLSGSVAAWREPSGIRATRRFMELTGMAHLRKTRRDEHEYRWLPILLHPQKLYERILQQGVATAPQVEVAREEAQRRASKKAFGATHQ